MICNHCGYQNFSDALYCSGCGQKLPRKKRKSKTGLIIAAVCLLVAGIGIGIAVSGLLFSGTGASGQAENSFGDFLGKQEKAEILQVLPAEDGSVAVLYTDGTVRVSGNDGFSAAVADWNQVAKLYYTQKLVWENGAFLDESHLVGLKDDGSVLSTNGAMSDWTNVKEIYSDWQGTVGVTHDGRVLAHGDWEDASFLTNLTDVETLVPPDIQASWGCLKKNGTVEFVSDAGNYGEYMPRWSNVKELRNSGHGFYVIKNDGTVDAEIEDYFEGLTGAVMVTDWRDWIFGISPDGQLLTHNGGSIYPNTGCMMVDEPGLPYYGEEVDIRRFNQVRDIIQSFGLVILNKDGTAEHIGDCPHWELSSWKNIESIYALNNYDGDAYYLYGIQRDGSVVRNCYDWQEVEQTVEEQYRGWKLREIYTGTGGVVGLTTDGKLVGDGAYENLDFSVFNTIS